MKTTIALFLERDDATRGLDALEDAGFTREQVSVLAQRETVEDLLDDERGEAATENAGVGAVGGGALGGLIGLIAGASALLVPGVGPALAFGTWATVLGSTAAGAGIGAAYGGFVGALVGFGVAEEQVHIYEEGVQRGGILILVHEADDDRLKLAEHLLAESGGTGVDIVEEPEE